MSLSTQVVPRWSWTKLMLAPRRRPQLQRLPSPLRVVRRSRNRPARRPRNRRLQNRLASLRSEAAPPAKAQRLPAAPVIAEVMQKAHELAAAKRARRKLCIRMTTMAAAVIQKSVTTAPATSATMPRRATSWCCVNGVRSSSTLGVLTRPVCRRMTRGFATSAKRCSHAKKRVRKPVNRRRRRGRHW